MVISDFDAPQTYWSKEKIEILAGDSKAKSRLKNDLVPIRLIMGKPKISPAFIGDIVEQFAYEISKNSQYFAKSSAEEVIKTFFKATRMVIQLTPSKVAIQITNTPGIYILAEIGEQNLHIDLNFSEETGKFEEMVVNIFFQKSQKLNVFGSFEEVSIEIQNYFGPIKKDIYEYFIQSNYAIPGQTYSPNIF